ncbi:hypothetical protein DIS24_g9969 [Lasiodiplodia hormozganensis]|uniref:Diadenosine 5',5'''-P1,P4-tetraphosphate phosphorylase 2 n=1 Tax=Lasiodiplodia hormozganensis TaxID=869390 RepID=A0AA40CHA9_9PEZI|nr:hypothetical protein DIS24_g9969 [Lasiodiplodia hormozganensis]
MPEQLTDSEVLKVFDDLLERQVIVYGDTDAELYEDGGIPFQFRVCDSLSQKPQFQDTPQSKPARTFGPGSDIEFADDRLLLATINETHHLVINKFSVFRPQFMLLTADSYRRQDEPLCLEDFQAVLDVSARLEASHYAIYNCMEPAGSSREHKHLQIFRRPVDFAFFPDRPDADTANIPFQYFLHYFNITPSSAHHLLDAYEILHAKASQSLGLGAGKETNNFPHNVILVKEWMLVIPRKRSNVEGVSANAAGMMGMIWVADAAKVRKWKELGPAWVLSQLGVTQENDAA